MQDTALRAPGTQSSPHISVTGLTISFGSFVLMRDVDFTVERGDVFLIMGGSGCGKSTLLKALTGLITPAAGSICYAGQDFTRADPDERAAIMRRVGILYQGGALWSSMTLAENVAMPLEQYTSLSPAEIRELAELKLALVGLAGFEDFSPSEISGGMRKRAGLARALALDPEIVFFDEPSAGLDPISAKMLDDLIQEIRESLGTTIVVVTHELASIFAIGTNGIFLDIDSRTAVAHGSPSEMLGAGDPKVVRFLTRDGSDTCGGSKEKP